MFLHLSCNYDMVTMCSSCPPYSPYPPFTVRKSLSLCFVQVNRGGNKGHRPQKMYWLYVFAFLGFQPSKACTRTDAGKCGDPLEKRLQDDKLLKEKLETHFTIRQLGKKWIGGSLFLSIQSYGKNLIHFPHRQCLVMCRWNNSMAWMSMTIHDESPVQKNGNCIQM